MNEPADGVQANETSPFPAIDDNDSTPRADRSFVERDETRDKDATPKKQKPIHRRSISGNLLKLLRTGSNERVNDDASSPEKSRSAMAGAMADTQRRKRKGSLRKSVLGKGREKERDRKGKSPLASPSSTAPGTPLASPTPTQLSTPRPSLESPDADADGDADSPASSPEHPPAVSLPVPPRWQAPFRTLSRVSIPSIRSSVPSLEPASSAASIHNASTTANNLSTSSDDAEHDSAPHVPNNTLRKIPTQTSIDSSTSSSWVYPSVSVASLSTAPSLLSDTLRRSTTHLGYFSSHHAAHAHARSPLASLPQSVAGSDDEADAGDEELDDDDTHDYGLTAFWGYIILVITYVVFVVGMGSCFGVWSWAWDVGETPYAPPELEDDASLPITGYYPALMVLTAVMAWVWVVVAWVGMKYFRHADF